MEIDRLFTLSQFVDYLDNPNPKQFILNEPPSDSIYKDAFCFRMISAYNYFLKQPLKKEMFVCDANSDAANICESELIYWQECQKKVIFEDITLSPHFFGDFLVQGERHTGGFIDNTGNFSCNRSKTLHDLAEATKGQLKLKNVEL